MSCDNNKNNKGCGCHNNPSPELPEVADMSMKVCDRNLNMLPMLQTYTTKVIKPNVHCKKNILTQQMMNCEGYKYVIKWDFDLNGQTITVPKDCIIEFDGGSLKNGTIVGQDTLFINVGDVDIWGESLTREGTWREHSGGGSSITVDDQLSETSENPVQNKVITRVINEIGGGDKGYDPEHHSGLGRKTLELKSGSNILTQDDFDQDHTIYVISYDFDLNGAEIHIPEGCMLDFEGGSINNGKCISNSTKLINYDGNSNALYGLFYDKNNDVLNFCYKKKSDFHITECYTFVDDMITAEPAEYQSIVKYRNYIFILGYPWSTAGSTSPNHYQLFIQVFDINEHYRFVGTAYTNVMSHANGATIVDDTLYVCPTDGYKYTSGEHQGEYINPDRKCLHTFSCIDIVTAATNHSSTAITNGKVDLSSLQSIAGVTSMDWLSGIDYDPIHKEFALDVSGIILFLDNNFNYIRKSENYKTVTIEKYGFEVGTQDIIYKNGIVYCNFGRFDNSREYNKGTLVNHPTILTIDSISGEVIDCKDIETPYHYWENQGGFKDDDNEKIWALFVNRKTDAISPSQIKTYTIVQIAPEPLTLKDTKLGIKTDSQRKRLLDNGQYLEIYVDSTTTDNIQEGTYNHPFKTLEQALHTVMTVSDNVVFRCRNGRSYSAQLGAVVNKIFRIQSYTGEGDSSTDTPLIDICGKFYNCHVSLRWVKLTPTKGFSGDAGNCCITLSKSLFMIRDCSVLPKNYNASITDEDNYHNKNNWSICDGLICGTDSKVDIINCTFIGLKHILYSYRGISATIDDLNFEGVTNFIKADNHDINVKVLNYNNNSYYEIDRFVSFTAAAKITEPCIKFCGYTIGNAITALVIAHKNNISNVFSYEQLQNTNFVEDSSAENGVPSWAKTLVTTEYNTTEENLNFNGVLTVGNYAYLIQYGVGRFENAFYNILGCAKRGTTEKKPISKYPFMIKNGYEYFDDTLNILLYWNGSGWIEENTGAINDNLIGKTINFLGDSYIANHMQSFELTWAYLLGQKHDMTVNNYGVNGNPIVAPVEQGENPPMVTRYADMADNVDYVIVVGGKNDYNQQLPIADFKTGLATLIEGLIDKYTPWNAERPSYCKIAFFTPWKIYINDADDPQPIKLEEYTRAIIEVCNEYSIPVFDSAHKSGVVMDNAIFRHRYCQSESDRSHFNSGGHRFFLPKAESFIESL